MTRILSVCGALPPHRYPQDDITEVFATVIRAEGTKLGLLRRIHRNAGVSQRHLALPLEQYADLGDFGQANDQFIVTGLELAAIAVTDALAAAGLGAADVDLITSTTITGVAVPSLDARLVGPLGLRPDVRRVPMMGLGCVAGAAGIARLDDYLTGHPTHVAVLLSVELCSLTLQGNDVSTANLVASGLFGDGAAAVVAVGDDHPSAQQPATDRPVVLASRSRLYPGTERAMGWDVGSTGLKIILGVEVPELVRTYVRDDVDDFLTRQGLTRDNIDWWVCHPGGPRVLEAMQEALEVGPEALQMTWDSLDRIGNLSSASVLHVLADTLADRPPTPGSYGLMLAMGPGFCLELVLLQARETAAVAP